MGHVGKIGIGVLYRYEEAEHLIDIPLTPSLEISITGMRTH